MSDPVRKPFYKKFGEWLMPSYFKSTTRKMSEHATSAADTAQSEAQPDSTKSTTQSGADKVGREKDNLFHHQHGSGHQARHATDKATTHRHHFWHGK